MVQRLGKLLAGVLGKFRQLHVAHPVPDDVHIAHALDLNNLTHEVQVHRRLCGGTENTDQDPRLRLSAQPTHNPIHRRVHLNRLSINADNNIATLDPRALSRGTRERSNHDSFTLTRLYLNSDTTKLPHQVLLERLVFLHIKKL